MSPAAAQSVGFIGLGIMGRPMAGHLLAAGHALFVHTRTRSRAAELLDRGATWCDTPADVARRAALVFTIVTDTPDVEAVALDPQRGLIAGASRGAIVVDMTTIRPAAARGLAEALGARGIAFLDAPVTGGQIGAQNATLTILAAGDRSAFDRVRPLLAHMGQRIVYVGPSGSGQALKACNQILCAVNMIGVCEALQLARACGLDLPAAIDALSGGAGGSWAWTTLGGKIAAGDLNPAFTIRLMQKDLRIVQETADGLHVPLPGTSLAQQLLRAVQSEPGGDGLGTQAMIRAYQRLASGGS